ncbi:hypothetical protein Pcac1_g15013 [Phytophthora cactorum]|uniref:Uncharacterized protein n=1 Tax=Phytophthora cactorum TaxID=29920 RepID=A0A8T1G4P0_9STRA|nr:hypothetical protein Pcac1_g15013 [Phytophthora cactorum]KAG2984376.1 hypothetical protein PC118_g8912 [Phytophthora cactorum]KAG3086730.1 hypothetical protein PC122_g9153 [Phytophthora cactorum]
MASMELQPPTLSQLPLDDDEYDGQEWGGQDDDELQEMMESLLWSPEAARPPHGRRRAHNDRYDELEFLRNKVRQMEEELRAMRLQHLDNVMPVPVSSAPTATLAFSSQMFGIPISSPPVSDAPPIWDLAARQQLWRERAAHENARLRTVLDTQASLAQSMEYQLGKRIREQLAGHALPFDSFSGTIAQDRGPDFALETETIESLRRGLDTAFEELDAVFDTNGLDRLETPSTDARNLTLDDEFDTVMEEVAMKFTGKSTNADFRVKQALRRHVEPDRQVVVWVSKAEAVEQQVSAYSNFAFIDKGYVVVKRPTFPDHSQTASTLLQICCLISPQMMRGCVLDVKTAGAFTEFVLSVMVASITATQELVESMLLEEAQQLHVLQQQE